MTIVSMTNASATTRKRMQAMRQRDTDCEVLIRRALLARGLRYRVNCRVSKMNKAQPDIVFSTAKVAIFIDGCYWHACSLHGTAPKNNAKWWADKFQANRTRDARADSMLRSEGWKVIRVWEHEDPSDVVHRIVAAIARQRPI
jgi:DNA mismatch endonuclease (patch repair protein)